jgi:O-antigen/teichoic acid export membrane protein
MSLLESVSVTIEPLEPGPQAASLRSRYQTGVAFNFVGAAFNQGSTFVFTVVAANLLGREAFGKYGMVASTLVALSQIAQLACGHTATKYVAEYRSCDKEKCGRVIGMLLVVVACAAGLVALGLLASVRWLANSVLKAPDLRFGLAIGAGIVFLNVLIGFFMGALAGLETYRILSWALVQFGVLYLVTCTLATWRFGLNGTFGGLFLSALLGCVLLGTALKSECHKMRIPIRFGLFPEARKILMGFALPGAVSSLTFLPALWIGDAILVRQPQGYAQMALFSAAYILMAAVLFIPNITYVVGWSLLNHQKGQRQWDQYRIVFKINLALTGAAVVVGVSALSVFGPAILRLFGKDFVDGRMVLLVMLAAAIPQALGLSALQHLLSQEHLWLSFFAVVLPRDFLLAALAAYLIPRHGAVGLAWAYAAAWMMALIIITPVTLSVGVRAAALDAP